MTPTATTTTTDYDQLPRLCWRCHAAKPDVSWLLTCLGRLWCWQCWMDHCESQG